MASSTVGKVYAEGLYRAALKVGQTEGVGEELGAFLGAVARDKRLRNFLGTPIVPAAAKRRLLGSALGGRASPTFLHFLQVLIQKRRLAALAEIHREYRKILDADAGLVRGELAVAHPVDAGLTQRLQGVLSGHFQRTVVLERRVEPALIGSMRVRVGDFLLDGSFKNRLEGLRRRLLSVRL